MTKNSKAALLVIDPQNDYFPEGKYPLWNTEQTLNNIEKAIAKARQNELPIVLIQHIADDSRGIAPFFNKGSSGAEIHPVIEQAAPEADIVIKQFADGFEQTTLQQTLDKYGIDELLICGMMTQNCVTHTAISKKAEAYKVTILADCCTTVDEMLHNIALNALSTRVELLPYEQAF
jgi:nicotinamidase-related amidase